MAKTGERSTSRRVQLNRPLSKPVAAVSEAINPAIFFDREPANVEHLRRQAPLPETADELCAVARSIGATRDVVYLGARATEKMVKTLSADGKLGQARVVHFATHGLLARETVWFAKTHAEPALLLTPPEQASDEDDGLLMASEVAQLTLNADWVVMSQRAIRQPEKNRTPKLCRGWLVPFSMPGPARCWSRIGMSIRNRQWRSLRRPLRI